MTNRYEYRVTWRRAGWRTTTSTKSRLFDRRDDATRFAAKVLRGLPGLTPVTVTVARRRVGAWQDGWE